MHVNLIIIIKVLLAQQCKLWAQCINLVKITERSQVMERAGESFFISLPEGRGGENHASLSAVLSHHKKDFQSLASSLENHPQLLEDTLEVLFSDPTCHLKSLYLKNNTILLYYGIFKRGRGKKKYVNVQESRKGYTQQTRTPIFTIATSLFRIWPTCIKEQPQEAKCKSSGTFKH